MKSESKDKNSRRKFLALSLLGGASLATGTVAAQTPAESGEKVKMLTTDGKLVEVDKSILEKASERRKASQQDVQEWINRK